MAQYYTDYTDVADGALPVGAALKRSAASGDYSVQTLDGFKRLRYLAPSGGVAHRGLSFPLESSGVVEVFATFRDTSSSSPSSARLVAFASNDNSSEYGCYLDISSTTPSERQFLTTRRVGGAVAGVQVVANLTPAPGSASSYSIRFRVTPGSPNNLKARYWPLGGAEPSTWLLDANDANLTLTTGWVGYLGFAQGAEIRYVEIGIGTNGDPAPAEPVPAIPVLSALTVSDITTTGARHTVTVTY